MKIKVVSQQELEAFGVRLGEALRGGEFIELIGDVGAGKTTLVKAVARGMGIASEVSSPSYTLSQIYEAPSGVRLIHYDFYRLDDPGILVDQLAETLSDEKVVTAVEWGGVVADVLPADRLQIQIVPLAETARQLLLTASGERSSRVMEQLT